MTILSVDDDPTNQIVIKRLLSNYNIIHAMSGKPSANDIYNDIVEGAEALDILNTRATPPDFILLDVMMPTMSGLEVCEKVREKFPMCDLPIIFVRPQHYC